MSENQVVVFQFDFHLAFPVLAVNDSHSENISTDQHVKGIPHKLSNVTAATVTVLLMISWRKATVAIIHIS